MRDQRTVKRRKVFYIPGFDPFPPRRYRELYRSEAQKQSQISGYHISQTALRIKDGFGWCIEGDIDGYHCQTDYEVLTWSDIVKTSMSDGIFSTYVQMLRTAWIYMSTGALWDIVKLRKGPVIAALYPIGFLIGQAAIAAMVAWAFIMMLLPFVGILAIAGSIIVWPILALFRRLDGKIFAYYLMQDYAHSAQLNGAYPKDLERRLLTFQKRVTDSVEQGKFDEILIIGHSSGAHLATSVLSGVIRSGKLAVSKVPLGFLTLGQVFPMVSFLPNARGLRSDMVCVSQCPDVFWVDVTAPGDGCAFALCDPLAVNGIATDNDAGPLVLSAAFSQTLKPETWARLKRRFFQLHFQYLCAFDNVGDYDFFRITAGHKTLFERFGNRSHSQSRITTPIARYRDIAS